MAIRKCPFCAELIQSQAIRCKHCQADLPSPISEKQAAAAEKNTALTSEIAKANELNKRFAKKATLPLAIAAVVALISTAVSAALAEISLGLTVLATVIFFIALLFVPWRYKGITAFLWMSSLFLYFGCFAIEPQELKDKQAKERQVSEAADAEKAQEEAAEAEKKTAEEKRTHDEEYAKTTAGIIYPGDTCTLTKMTFGADTLENYKEMSDELFANDKEGLGQLLIAGKICALPVGTKVLLIDDKMEWTTETKAKIRVLSGEMKGKGIWIAKEGLKPIARGAVYQTGLQE